MKYIIILVLLVALTVPALAQEGSLSVACDNEEYILYFSADGFWTLSCNENFFFVVESPVEDDLRQVRALVRLIEEMPEWQTRYIDSGPVTNFPEDTCSLLVLIKLNEDELLSVEFNREKVDCNTYPQQEIGVNEKGLITMSFDGMRVTLFRPN